MSDLTNQFLGGYHFQWLIARGGMASVYLGQHADDPTAPPVALKVLHPHLAATPQVRKRFLREAEIGQRLQHSHIVPVLDLVEEEDYLFIVTPYLSGGSLADRIERQGALSWDETVAVARQVGDALTYAHQQGVIHRDVKPSNILFDDRGVAHLADFGVAHEVDASTLTASGFQPGTVAYMSPEQIQGIEVGPASDQFSLAATLFRALTGSLPFTGTTTAALTYQIVHEPPQKLPRRPDIPKGAQKVLAKALAKNPAERYPDMPAFIDALERATAGRGAGLPAWAKVVAVGLILSLLVVAGVAWAHMKSASSDTAAISVPVTSVATPPPSETQENAQKPAAAGQEETPAAVPTALVPPGVTIEDAQTTPVDSIDYATVSAVSTAQTVTTGDSDAPTPTLISPTTASGANEPTPTLILPTPRPKRPPAKPSPKPAPTTPPKTNSSQTPGPRVALVRPAQNALFATDTGEFVWQLQKGALQPNQKFELVFYQCGQDPMIAGFSPIGATTSTQVTVNLKGVDDTLNLFHSGEWCWDVLVGHEKDGRWIRDLNASHAGLRFTYQRPGGGGGSPPSESPLPTPPFDE